MKKITCALVALLLMLCLPWAVLAEEGENLLKNGDFSETDGGEPVGWRRDMWLTDAGVSLLTVDEDGYDGNCVTVTNVDENDARFAQTVDVEPDTLYRVSGMIRAENCDADGYGATLSIEDVFVYSDGLYDTDGKWEYAELYGWTGPDQTTLTVFARVGGYGTLSRGSASFDDLALTRVDEAPGDAAVYDFYREETFGGDDDDGADDDGETEPPRNTEAWLLFTCVYALAVMGFTRKRGRSAEPVGRKKLWALFALALVAALALRLVIAARVRGYNTDINCFSGWSERMFTLGPGRFYDPDYFCDYPPLYMLLLWLVAALRRVLGIAVGSPGYLVLLKLLPILADLAGAALVWRVARRRLSENGAALLGLMMAFNPAAIANSAAWGQIDAVLALFIALCALYAADGKTIPALVCFGAALLVKPQALLFGPVGLVAILCGIFCARGEARKGRIRDALIGLVACLGLIYLVGLLCCLGQPLTRPVTWLIELYTETLQGYRYVTVNTLNLYYLLGLNWADAGNHAGVTALAWVLFGISQACCMWLTVAGRRQPRRLFLTGGLLMVLICTFGPMIHERYIYPALLLIALAFACERDRRLLVSLTALTCTLFLNEILVLQGGMTEANYGHLQDSEHWLNCVISVVNILNTLLLGWTAFDICVRDRIIPLAPPVPDAMPSGAYTLSLAPNYRMGIRRVDVLLMGAVTLLYSVLAFTNLGVIAAPQSGWTASQSGEAVVFDLGESRTWQMTYYGGICNSTFTVELSDDGETWSAPTFARYNQGEIFRWLWFVPMDADMNELYSAPADAVPGAPRWHCMDEDTHPRQTARYARITAQSAGLILYEVAFLDEDSKPMPIAGVSQSGQTEASESSAATLIDEQRTVPAYPSYLNSSYFDEIYHARTAFEHLHGMNAYEWTHPPLGKVLMMAGVQLFGMTPFGWRFMGALVGVLMVPLMYLLVKQLTKDTRLSFIAMAMMALDSMHFTQTRIATIDSYAVFWIMLMYLFMFRYCQMSWNRESLGRTLIPLGLCGVTMGIAWATKWVGLYASAGLAILFFWTVYRRMREAFALRDAGQSRQFSQNLKNLAITLAFCVAFFIVIPVLIYYFSYFWLLRPEGVRTFGDMLSGERVRRVVELQKSIYGYHAGLGGDTHYFRSPWYQWPVIWWPMWYYSGTGYMPEGMISSISCMGNPAVWWFGLAAIVFVTVRLCWVRRASRKDVMVLIGFASQFLPWVIVPRSTFIYHYFASVPFIIMASALLLDAIRKRNEKAFSAVSGGLLAAALILFAAFYPLESGLPCSRDYAKYLRWFKWYNY